VLVPYSVFYDVAGDRIAGLRIHMPVEDLVRQISGAEAAGQPA
jgi:hypothetical protein